MRKADILILLDYNYWANRQILAAVAGLPAERFTSPSTITWRNVRGTLVHTLDVERSWRGRLRGEPRESWDRSLPDDDYPTVASLAAHWERDEAEMRMWLDGLDDTDMASVVDLGPRDRFPLWFFLLHIVTHGAEQRRDVAILLTQAGVDPPQLEFLYYADSLRHPDAPRPA